MLLIKDLGVQLQTRYTSGREESEVSTQKDRVGKGSFPRLNDSTFPTTCRQLHIIVCGPRAGAGGGDQRRHHPAARGLLPGLCRGRPGFPACGVPGKDKAKGKGRGLGGCHERWNDGKTLFCARAPVRNGGRSCLAALLSRLGQLTVNLSAHLYI